MQTAVPASRDVVNCAACQPSALYHSKDSKVRLSLASAGCACYHSWLWQVPAAGAHASLHGCMQCISSSCTSCFCCLIPFLKRCLLFRPHFTNPGSLKNFTRRRKAGKYLSSLNTPQTAECCLFRLCAWHDAGLTQTMQLQRWLLHPGTNPKPPPGEVIETHLW